MTNTKWLRRALLGGVALSVMASGAQADELSELKAQLEALQNRVGQLEQQPSRVALPEGASFLTLTRGSADITDRGTFTASRDQRPSDRGFTISVTPTADLPAPIAEVVVYGYVKGDVIYDFDKDLGPTFSVPGIWSSSGRGDNHIRLHAWQSRFGIRSRTDTAIGQIRTQIEGDFFGAPFGNHLGEFRLRHAFGEWDVTPEWTLLIGQTWSTANLHPIGVSTVDFSGSAGPNAFPRKGQVRLTYHSGPISWAVAIERPSRESTAQWPNLASYIQFDAPGGHQFIVTGVLADYDDVPDRSGVGWAVQAGANINLADIATLTVGGGYGKHEHCSILAQHAWCNRSDADKDAFAITSEGGFVLSTPITFSGVDFLSDRGWGILAGLSFGLTDTTTFNVQYGWTRLENDFEHIKGINHVDVHTLHANILWRPVRQMQLGWEVMWGKHRFSGGDFGEPVFVEDADRFSDPKTSRSDDAIRAQFGAWFFF